MTGQLLTFSSTNTRQSVDIVLTEDTASEGSEEFTAHLEIIGTVDSSIQLEQNEAIVDIQDEDRKFTNSEQYQASYTDINYSYV